MFVDDARFAPETCDFKSNALNDFAANKLPDLAKKLFVY